MRRIFEPLLIFVAFLVVLTGSFAYKSYQDSASDFGNFRWVYDGELTGKWKAIMTADTSSIPSPYAFSGISIPDNDFPN